jgi:hypothetical protein
LVRSAPEYRDNVHCGTPRTVTGASRERYNILIAV